MIIFGVKPETITQRVNHEILEAHAEEVAFLCFQRSILLDRHDVVLDDLKEHDRYIMANLDGLLLTPEDSWDICLRLIDEDDEYIFAPTYLATATLALTL